MAQSGYEPGPYGIWVTSSTRWDRIAPTTDEFRLKALFIKTKKKALFISSTPHYSRPSFICKSPIKSQWSSQVWSTDLNLWNLCIIIILLQLCWIKVIYKIIISATTNTKFWKLPNFKHTNVFGQANKHANMFGLVAFRAWTACSCHCATLISSHPWKSDSSTTGKAKVGKAKIVFLDNNIEKLVVISLITFLRFAYHFLFCFYTFSHFVSFPLCLFYHFFSRLLPIKPCCFPKS